MSSFWNVHRDVAVPGLPVADCRLRTGIYRPPGLPHPESEYSPNSAVAHTRGRAPEGCCGKSYASGDWFLHPSTRNDVPAGLRSAYKASAGIRETPRSERIQRLSPDFCNSWKLPGRFLPEPCGRAHALEYNINRRIAAAFEHSRGGHSWSIHRQKGSMRFHRGGSWPHKLQWDSR